MLQSKLIKKHKNISHGFFNSLGGFSKGIYKSLNCGIGSKDKKKFINQNLNKVCKKVDCLKTKLFLLNQVHSSKVHIINKIPKNRLVGDAVITNKKKIAIAILTADCAPILLYDPKNKMIGAVHSGWKGAYKNIIKKTVKKLIENGCKVKNLIAVIGPCIGIKSYEVKNDFFNRFLKIDKSNKKFFIIKNKKIFFSLNEYIENQLKYTGIKKIEIIKKDTYLSKNNFFSSRRSLKNKFNDYGRNISIIMIK
tara:strand:+ start:33 stop:785 length:753 start_codon:yes stop_codon:yes gene_type:complete